MVVDWLRGNEQIQRCPRKQYIWEEEEEVLHPYYLFGRTERPDRTGTKSGLLDVEGHHRRWIWKPIRGGNLRRVPFVLIGLARPRILHGPKHVFLDRKGTNDHKQPLSVPLVPMPFMGNQDTPS